MSEDRQMGGISLHRQVAVWTGLGVSTATRHWHCVGVRLLLSPWGQEPITVAVDAAAAQLKNTQ